MISMFKRFAGRDRNGGCRSIFRRFFFKSIRNGTNLIHCDDAVTGLVGAQITRVTSKKVVATVHGLDVILPIPWYQRRLRSALQLIDSVVCVSQATAEEVRKRGVDDAKITVIPNAAEKVDIYTPRNNLLYQRLKNAIGVDLKGKKVLFSLGRPLRRKGFDKFITDVFENLPGDFVYIIAGPKPKMPGWLKRSRSFLNDDYKKWISLASGSDTVHDNLIGLSSHPRVFYINGVTDELRDSLFAVSDLFIMPNQSVEGDMEGFGIVALEAAVRGIPVIASGIEGITDAVIEGENGFCVPAGDSKRMSDIIIELSNNSENLKYLGQRAKVFTEKRFCIESIIEQYKHLFENIIESNHSEQTADLNTFTL